MVTVFIGFHLGSLVRAEVSSGLLEFTCVRPYARNARWVHSDSRGLTRALRKGAGFIQVSVGSLGRNMGSSPSFAFKWIHSGALCSHQAH